MEFKAGDFVFCKIHGDIGFLEDNDVHNTAYVLRIRGLTFTIDGKYRTDSNDVVLIKIPKTFIIRKMLDE